MEFRSFGNEISKTHIITDLPFANHTMNNGTMSEAMYILLYNDSLQAETLGDACLIAVLASITMLLHLVDMFIQKIEPYKERKNLPPHQVKKKNNSIALQRIWKSFFESISDGL